MSDTAEGASGADPLHERPADLLGQLIQFETVNPPGDERECVEWIADRLADYGVDAETYAMDPDRPNLLARLPGGDAPALLLYGHVDVVPTTGQDWTHPPFSGLVEDGYVWGRGALDMKGGVSMMLSTFLRAAAEDVDLAGDLLLCIVSDEEGGGDHGAGFLVEEHPELFEDVEYALGEFGGFAAEIAGERFYPIQVNEKQVCWLRAIFRGEGGHGSRPREKSALSDMARAITAVSENRLPVRIVPTVEEMIEAIAAELPPEVDDEFRALLDPERTDEVLDALGEDGELFDAILHDTANPTVVRGGDKENVIPSEVSVTLDCRLLPGQGRSDIEAELREVIPDDVDVEFETIRHEPFPAETDEGLFELLAGVLEDSDPDGTAVPYILPGGTDGRHLARVGVQSYGFTPLNLPADFEFMSLVHAADERMPIECLEFGAEAMYEAVVRYGR